MINVRNGFFFFISCMWNSHYHKISLLIKPESWVLPGTIWTPSQCCEQVQRGWLGLSDFGLFSSCLGPWMQCSHARTRFGGVGFVEEWNKIEDGRMWCSGTHAMLCWFRCITRDTWKVMLEGSRMMHGNTFANSCHPNLLSRMTWKFFLKHEYLLSRDVWNGPSQINNCFWNKILNNFIFQTKIWYDIFNQLI